MPSNIVNIYVIIFGKPIHFWHLVYIWLLYPTCYVSFSNIIFKHNMIKIANIYVRTTGYILQMIYICWCMENSQHYMLSNPDFNNIPIDHYKWEIFTTFMLSCGIYVTRSLNWLYVEVIANIWCYLYTRKTDFH